MGAPNPWFEGSPPLSSSEILKEGEHPLDLIRDFILNWPGEETVKFDFETRHNRLIQIIAGYPEIDVGRYPLDWPLSKKANDALRLTMYLDSIKSPDGKTSLRSVLLNQSTRVKQFETENEFGKAHKRMLSVLFLGIRNARNIVDNISLTHSEHKLLLVLHSNNQRRVSKFWPRTEMKLILTNPTAEFLEWEDLNYLPRVKEDHKPREFCDSWKDNTDLSMVNHGRIVSVKMSKIQSWISNWSECSLGGNDSFGATLLRGASAILESVMSGLRASIIDNYGVESIVVDGGGRIVFIGDDNSENILLESFYNVFSISNLKVPYFNFEIRKVARILSCKTGKDKLTQHDFNLIYGILKTDNNELDKSQIFDKRREWALMHLPRLSITEIGEKPDDGFNSLRHDDCSICNSKIDLTNVDQSVGWDSKMENLNYPICNFHRLLYFVGKAQRMVNSTTKSQGKPHNLSLKSPERKVVAIARLDLNSLGILFTSNFEEGKETSHDLRRRRSIRFNSQWWDIVRSSLNLDNLEFDRIVPWVAAGDDITLADYVPTESSEPTQLFEVLRLIASKLNDLSNDEYGFFKLSYGAGVSFRGEKEQKRSISTMMSESDDSENDAKNLWKEKMSRECRIMVTKQDGQVKGFEPVVLCGEKNAHWYGDSVVSFDKVGTNFGLP